MSPYVKYNCGCIEGPVPGISCWRHGTGIENKIVLSPATSREENKRGVAQYIDCPMGRPIKIWMSNDKCDGASLCPGRYDCKYKRHRAQGKLL